MMAQSGRAPAALQDMPELEPGLAFYAEAFDRLGTERQYSQFPGPIPYSKILAYGKEEGLRGDELRYFCEVIKKLDAWELTELGKKIDSGKPKSGGKGAAGRFKAGSS